MFISSTTMRISNRGERKRCAKPKCRRRAVRLPFQPSLEVLEDRVLLDGSVIRWDANNRPPKVDLPHNKDMSRGFFNRLYASSEDSNATPPLAKDEVKGSLTKTPYTANASYQTQNTTVSGQKFFATAQAIANVGPKGNSWDSQSSVADIDVVRGNPRNVVETAKALWAISDPAVYPIKAGDVFAITFSPDSSWNALFPFGANYNGLASTSGTVRTDLPGFNDLIHWSIELDTSNPDHPDIRFQSNPLLGLNDTAIAADIKSRFLYLGGTGNYAFNDSGFSLGATFAIPPGSPTTMQVSVDLDQQVGADAPGDLAAPFLPEVYPVGQAPAAVALGNFYGIPELAVANSGSNTVSVLSDYYGDGSFYSSDPYPVGSRPVAVAMADLTGRGMSDLIVANAGSNTVSVLRADGFGGFYLAGTYAVGSQPVSVAVGDFLGNGIPDIVAANAGSNSLSVLMGDGAGGFFGAVNYSLAGRPTSVVTGDFLGNGISDIAVTTNNFADEGSVTVLLGTPYGELIPAGNYATGTDAVAVQAASVYNDGNMDLVVVNQLSQGISVLVANGDGTFQPAQNYYVGMEPSGVALADLDGDGIPDLAVSRQRDSSVMVLHGNGDGTFQPEWIAPVGRGPVGLVAGNFSYYSYASDLAVVDHDSNALTILHNGFWGKPAPGGGSAGDHHNIVPGTSSRGGDAHRLRLVHSVFPPVAVSASQIGLPLHVDIAADQGQAERPATSLAQPLFSRGSSPLGTESNIVSTAIAIARTKDRVHGLRLEAVTLEDLDDFFAIGSIEQGLLQPES